MSPRKKFTGLVPDEPEIDAVVEPEAPPPPEPEPAPAPAGTPEFEEECPRCHSRDLVWHPASNYPSVGATGLRKCRACNQSKAMVRTR